MPPGDGSVAGADTARRLPFTQQPSEVQLPQTQAPSQPGLAFCLAPALGQQATVTQCAAPTAQAPLVQQYAKALRGTQAAHLGAAAPAAAALAPRTMGMLNGLPTSLWERGSAAHAGMPAADAAPQPASFRGPGLGVPEAAGLAEVVPRWTPNHGLGEHSHFFVPGCSPPLTQKGFWC